MAASLWNKEPSVPLVRGLRISGVFHLHSVPRRNLNVIVKNAGNGGHMKRALRHMADAIGIWLILVTVHREDDRVLGRLPLTGSPR